MFTTAVESMARSDRFLASYRTYRSYGPNEADGRCVLACRLNHNPAFSFRLHAVYCYYAEDTVERNILDLAAKQGLSLYTRDNAAGTLNVTPFAADADKKKVDAPAKKVQKGDFVYK